MKKVCSILLALLLALTAAIPGFASEVDPDTVSLSTQDTIEATQPEPAETPVEPEPPTPEEPESPEPGTETVLPEPEESESPEQPSETESPAQEDTEPPEAATETGSPEPEESESPEQPSETKSPAQEETEPPEAPTETELPEPEEESESPEQSSGTEPPAQEDSESPDLPAETESPELEESELSEPPEESETAVPEEPSEDLDIEIDDAPVIQVTVPRSGRVIINPYSLPVEIGDEVSTDQITSETMMIYNSSDVPVIVSATVVGHISESSNMTFSSVPVEPDSIEKNIFLYAEFQNEDGLWSGGFNSGDNQILIGEGISAAKDVLTLDAGSSESVFRIFGETSVCPADP